MVSRATEVNDVVVIFYTFLSYLPADFLMHILIV